MKPDQYNPKAREAFGRSLIDIGVAIFKSLILLFTVVPVTVILKAVFSGDDGISMLHQLLDLSGGTKALLLGFIAVSFLMGHLLRKAGLRYLHELERDGGETLGIKGPPL